MARLTRNSYKRKIILFAVFVFISIALISTGFAAWVMSTDAQKDANGNVSVGLVTDSSLEIKLTNETPLDGFSFLFEPAEGDTTGRVRLEKTDNPPFEQLKYTITGQISNPDILDSLTIEMVLPEGMQEAMNLGYIDLPECAKSVQLIPVNSETGEFEYTIEFEWGTKFGKTNEVAGLNPSLYYDNHQTGKGVSDSEVKEVLENLRACVYGYYDDLKAASGAEARKAVIEAHKDDELPTFKVTIKAKAN